MPWCDSCGRYFGKESLTPSGNCPTCGSKLDRPGPADEPAAEGAPGKGIPWHFWILVAALAIYLGWRLAQGVGWLVHHL